MQFQSHCLASWKLAPAVMGHSRVVDSSIQAAAGHRAIGHGPINHRGLQRTAWPFRAAARAFLAFIYAGAAAANTTYTSGSCYPGLAIRNVEHRVSKLLILA